MISGKPLVSIITVSLNSERTIRDTIESVLKQRYNAIEYIIVDGLSKDNTIPIVSDY
ncbi:MAG TPA: glycosyltransferase, partial [Acholeplasmataceae bacterium]|nr:glycosyltransferase [Acholeplasmataceae bacterium]